MTQHKCSGVVRVACDRRRVAGEGGRVGTEGGMAADEFLVAGVRPGSELLRTPSSGIPRKYEKYWFASRFWFFRGGK